jgi:hypothetical protein
MFVDSDDWLDLKACEDTYYYAEYHQADVVFFQLYYYESDVATLRANCNNNIPLICDRLEAKKQLITNFPQFGLGAVKLWRTEFLSQYSLRFFEGLINEDYLFAWQAVTRTKRMAFLQKWLYFYRQHGASITGSHGKERLDIFRVLALIEKDLRQTGNYDSYRDEFIVRKLGEGHHLCRIIRPDLKQKAKAMFMEMIGEEEMDYLHNRAAPHERDLFLSFFGNRTAWCRHYLRMIVPFFRFLRFRFIIRRVEALIRFLRGKKKKTKDKEYQEPVVNEQLADLVCQLSREVVELKAFRAEEHHEISRH